MFLVNLSPFAISTLALLSPNIIINDIFACEKRGRERHTKHSLALSNLRFRGKEEKASREDASNVTHRSALAQRFKFDAKKKELK